MQAILLYFWQLCLLRESPERIPASPTLALWATLAYLVIGMISFAVSRDQLSVSTVFGVSFLSIAIESTALVALLAFKRHQQRFYPTLVAIFSCNSLLLIALLPVNYILATLEPGMTLEIVNTLSLISLFWWLTIVGFILKEAAGISIFQGIVLAFVIELLVAVAIRSLFSEFA